MRRVTPAPPMRHGCVTRSTPPSPRGSNRAAWRSAANAATPRNPMPARLLTPRVRAWREKCTVGQPSPSGVPSPSHPGACRMLVQPLRSPDFRRAPASDTTLEPKVAVLLNANARKVDARVVKSLSHVVPEQDLFLSRSPLDARRITQTVLERGYPLVFTGGGDGTFVGFVNEFFRQLEPRGRFAGQPLPRFGILKLGTGNGLANFVNASNPSGDGILHDVVRALAGDVASVRRMDMVMVDG